MPSPESVRKGVGLWSFPGAERGLKQLRVAWFYNWQAAPPEGVGVGTEFVPMIWGKTDVSPGNLAKAKRSGRTLLGFNEPDQKKQAALTVKRALELWPQLAATGMRLGSPATARRADSARGWMARFMKGAAERGYRVDFICVHYYPDDLRNPAAAAENLRWFLQKVHGRYQKPIWLTEFALADWKMAASPAQQQAFLRAVWPLLESLPFLERYAWFALPPNPSGDGGALAGANLCDESGELNGTGQVYGGINRSGQK